MTIKNMIDGIRFPEPQEPYGYDMTAEELMAEWDKEAEKAELIKKEFDEAMRRLEEVAYKYEQESFQAMIKDYEVCNG